MHTRQTDTTEDDPPPPPDPEVFTLPFRTAGFKIWVTANSEDLPTYDYPYTRPGEGPQMQADDAAEGIIRKYVECEPETITMVEYKYDRATFKHARVKFGPTIRLEFSADGKRMDTHLDNWKYGHWEQSHFKFEGRSLGRLKDKPEAFGRRPPIIQDLKFVLATFGKWLSVLCQLSLLLILVEVQKDKKKPRPFNGEFKVRMWRVHSTKSSEEDKKIHASALIEHQKRNEKQTLSEGQTVGDAIQVVAE
jgi:hypothetical protein